MEYEIVWKGEIVDTASERAAAEYLLTEYNMAFKGGCRLRQKRL